MSQDAAVGIVFALTILKYKDYQESICFEDSKLIVQILHIDDYITGECINATDARATFEALVEEYLEMCAKVDKAPCKPFKGSFNVRVGPELHRRAAQAAVCVHTSLNNLLEMALVEKLEKTRSAQQLVEEVIQQIVADAVWEPPPITRQIPHDFVRDQVFEDVFATAKLQAH